MKAKYYIGILSALFLTYFPISAQYAGNGYRNNDDTRIVINNYYDDYDYFYSSRINRFHRSYVTFDYYSPLFTETYWYNYRPYTWGISIYDVNPGFGVEYNFYYPHYYSPGYLFGYGWNDPYYYSYYMLNRPYYCNFWYTPVFISVGFGNRWANHYWGWNRYNFWNRHYWRDYYRPVYYTNNYYHNYNYRSTRFSTRYSNSAGGDALSQSRRQESSSTAITGNDSRRIAPANNPVQISTENRRSSEARTTTSISSNNTNTRRSNINSSVSMNRSVITGRTGSEVQPVSRRQPNISVPERSVSSRVPAPTSAERRVSVPNRGIPAMNRAATVQSRAPVTSRRESSMTGINAIARGNSNVSSSRSSSGSSQGSRRKQ